MSKISLKPATSSDAEVIYNAWGTNPENFYYLSAPVQKSLEDSKAYLADLFQKPENIAFHIILSETDEVIGIIKALMDGPKAKVGYVVDKKYSGQGYATTALKEIVALLKTNDSISRIWATCSTENIATMKVLEKSGFQREGLHPKWMVYPARGEEARDNYFYVHVA